MTLRAFFRCRHRPELRGFLKEGLYRPGFSEIAAYYVNKTFAEVGRKFDLRLCLKNVTEDLLVTSAELIEDLEFRRNVPVGKRT